MSLTLALLSLIYVIGCPIFSVMLLYRKKAKLREPDFKSKYDSIYQNVDYYKKKALQSTSWFFVRRFFFAGVIVFCTSSIVLQIFLADVLSTCMLIYFITVKPMNTSLNNLTQILNEIFVLISVWLMFHFTEFVNDPVTRYHLA